MERRVRLFIPESHNTNVNNKRFCTLTGQAELNLNTLTITITNRNCKLYTRSDVIAPEKTEKIGAITFHPAR